MEVAVWVGVGVWMGVAVWIGVGVWVGIGVGVPTAQPEMMAAVKARAINILSGFEIALVGRWMLDIGFQSPTSNLQPPISNLQSLISIMMSTIEVIIGRLRDAGHERGADLPLQPARVVQVDT